MKKRDLKLESKTNQPAEKAFPITQEQANLIVNIQSGHDALLKQAQEVVNNSAQKVNAAIAGVLAGHGITEASALRVEPAKDGEPPKLVIAA